MSRLDRDWFPRDEGMQFPPTRARIERENRAQHVIQITIDAKGGRTEACRFCGKAGARLREPCAMPIRVLGIPVMGEVK